tara:strand:+ start:11338 stop:12219 length:882 start_codon:yes stop_codon:yes gene_type:complete
MVDIKKSIKDGIKTFEAEINGEKIEWDEGLTYNSHLQIEKLLSSQKLVSGMPDEMLFVIVHQSMELWLKLFIHELDLITESVKNNDIKKPLKTFDRIASVQRHMTQSWEILATLTSNDFLTFRNYLKKASGFQSYQYRELEFKLGNKNKDLVVVHKENKPIYEHLINVANSPSLYDEVLMYLSRQNFNIPSNLIKRDWSIAYMPSENVENIWRDIYKNSEKYWDIYMLAERMTSLEYYFQEWRFKHMKTVSRVIGNKKGTGGSAGVNYLVKALDLSFFPELWSMRTYMNNENA